jgi:hypothetical protein
VHPRYLDAKGLVAAWREALLAQKVLAGATRGYTRHPQLARFRSHRSPLDAVAAFLHGLAKEAQRRGYRFDTSKIARAKSRCRLQASHGQLLYEWEHLRAKLRSRAPEYYRKITTITVPEPHPLFRVRPGGISEWETRRTASRSEPLPSGRGSG